MRSLFFILFFTPLFVAAQITDSFSDDDFSSNPAWRGDSIEFTVNPSRQLQLNNTGAGSSFLSTPSSSSLDNVEWHFYIKQSFSPSSGNYGRVYLASDQSDLEGSVNGYYLQFGESGNLDAVELFRQSGTTSTSIARGTNAQIASSFAMGIKVTRDAAGNWEVFTDVSGGTAYKLACTGTDTVYATTSYFGVATVYSASNSTKFYFDDFYIGPVVIDTIVPALVSSTVISNTKIDLVFSENVDLATSQIPGNYSADHGLGSPLTATRDAVDLNLVHLTFANAFINERTYMLSVMNVQDFNSNAIATTTIGFTYYQIKPHDLVINEILFNPKAGGVDFVEIYNRSNQPIDLKTITISQYDTVNKVLVSVSDISATSYFINPKQYIVLSEDQFAVKSQYRTLNPNGFIDLSNLPAMNIDGGTVCLASDSTVIDLFSYSDDMHFPLLNDTKGVSLERIDFDRPAQDRSNWHSAAETAGFASPAYKNSQYNNAGETNDAIKIEPEIFSPDEDGVNDVVTINYHFDAPGFFANIIIYDSKGRPVRSLIQNQLLGTSGAVSWDGINENREKSRIGIYIIYLEAIDLGGNVRYYKKTCVLGGKL